MNKEFICNNGTVTISDEKGILRLVDYNDNINEILITENMIEEIEVELEKARNAKIDYEKSKVYEKKDIFNFISSILIGTFLVAICLNFLTSNAIINSIVGSFKFGTTVCLILSPLIAACIAIKLIYGNCKLKYLTKKLKGTINTIDALSKSLDLEKDKLEKLKKCDSINQQISNEQLLVQKVDTKDQFNKLKNHIQLCYNCGYYDEKYRRYYEKNVIYEKLRKEYTDEEIFFIKEYLEDEEKAKVLQKV